VNPTFLVIIIVMFGAMYAMTRSAKKKQQQAVEMRNKMEPGSGIRTIGGMYALVKSVEEETVELEVAPGVHAIYAKNAIAVVMDGAEYNRIVHGDTPDEADDVEDESDTDAVVAETVELDKKGVDETEPAQADSDVSDLKPADAASVGTQTDADKGVTAK
jgi:preprotein translocase subunit YajC